MKTDETPHIEAGSLQQTQNSERSLKDVPIFQLPFMVEGQDESYLLGRI